MVEDNGGQQTALKYIGVGFEFAAAVGLGLYVGYRADLRYNSDPWGLLVGAAVGLAAGLYLLVKAASKMMQEFGESKDGSPPDEPDAKI